MGATTSCTAQAATRAAATCPWDDDNDYQFDEDGPEDLNGNGVIEQIRKYVPGQGNYKKSSADPRIMEACKPGEACDYVMLGQEGLDHDADGRVGEDGLGSYDPNRNFASDWQPNYVQSGAMDYPFELPEAKAVNDFWVSHPNIAGLQTYHNNGGMILRSPGAEMGLASTRPLTFAPMTNWGETPSGCCRTTATW